MKSCKMWGFGWNIGIAGLAKFLATTGLFIGRVIGEPFNNIPINNSDLITSTNTKHKKSAITPESNPNLCFPKS
jgi:hypothetical protein